MKTLQVTVNALAVYSSSIQVPDDMGLEEAIKYAADHLNEIPMGTLEYVGDAGLDADNCSFDD